MTKKTINIGQSPNDQTGDSLRAAFGKINDNFSELYAASNISFPSQTGNAGKYLTTDGTHLSWHTVTIPTDISQLTDTTNILDAADVVIAVGGTPPASPAVGKLWYDTTSGRMYVFYDHNWVDTNPR